MRQHLIGLAGPAGSGKDTVAAILKAHFDYWPYAFARPIKDALKVMGIVEPLSREEKELPLEGRTFSFRSAAQTLGTEWARNLDKDFWLNLAKENVSDRPLVVISDVRFPNEADWIRGAGGEIWHIQGRQATLHGESKVHRSEVPVTQHAADKVVDNTCSLEQLQVQVFQLVNTVLVLD